MHVFLYPLVEIEAAPVCLPHARHARLDAETSLVPAGADVLDIPHGQRSWPYQAHFSTYDIDELWQLIDARATKPVADSCHTGVVADLENRAACLIQVFQRSLHGGCIGNHRPKLECAKPFPVVTDPFLNEEHRSGRVELDCRRNHDEQRSENDQAERRRDHVDQSLGEQTDGFARSTRDRQDRCAVHFIDVSAAPVEVGNPRDDADSLCLAPHMRPRVRR